MRLTTYVNPVPRLKLVELYLQFPIRLHSEYRNKFTFTLREWKLLYSSYVKRSGSSSDFVWRISSCPLSSKPWKHLHSLWLCNGSRYVTATGRRTTWRRESGSMVNLNWRRFVHLNWGTNLKCSQSDWTTMMVCVLSETLTALPTNTL